MGDADSMQTVNQLATALVWAGERPDRTGCLAAIISLPPTSRFIHTPRPKRLSSALAAARELHLPPELLSNTIGEHRN